MESEGRLGSRRIEHQVVAGKAGDDVDVITYVDAIEEHLAGRRRALEHAAVHEHEPEVMPRVPAPASRKGNTV